MATQFVSTSHPLSSSAAAPALYARKITRVVPTSRIMRPRKRREEKPIQDREKLVIDMLPLVKRVALKIRKRLPAQVEFDDLLSDGVVGLVDAVAKFNPRKRVKLESYARHRIRGSILDGLRGADPVPRDLRRKHKDFQKLNQELEADLGRPVKDEEMAAGLGMTLVQWHHDLNEIQSAGIDCGARTLSAGLTFMQTFGRAGVSRGGRSQCFRPLLSSRTAGNPHSRTYPLGGARPADHHPLLLSRTDDAGNRQSHERGRIAGVAAPCGSTGSPEGRHSFRLRLNNPSWKRKTWHSLDGSGRWGLKIILRPGCGSLVLNCID